jgi:hypothetical protein
MTSSPVVSPSWRLNEVVEGERREHGAVAVDISLHEKSSATNAVEVDDLLFVAIGICESSVI